MKIPKPIQEVFDRFPLKTYPPVLLLNEACSKQYYFGLKSGDSPENSSSETFVLGVHNVMPVDINGSIKYAATDPVGLSHSLILCFRNSLRLPSDIADTTSQHALMPLSYLASPNDELPIMVEKTGKTQEVVCTCELINSVTSKYFKDPAESLLNDLLDGFYDLWIFALIYDIPLINPSACEAFFYQDGKVSEFGNIITTKVLNDMSRWGSFRQRYSYLFHDNYAYLKNARELVSGYNSSNKKRFQQSYFSKLIEFDSSIPLFMEFFKNSETSEAKSILQLKFAAYFICINFFVPKDTHLSRTVYTKHKDALGFSMKLLSTF